MSADFLNKASISSVQFSCSVRVFSNESVLHIRWPKYWSFSFSISPSNEYCRLINFRMDWLDLLAVQGTLKSLLQHHMLSCFSCVKLFAASWSVIHQAPLSMGFFRQEYWSGLPFPTPGDLPIPGMEPTSLVSPALVGRFFTSSATWEALLNCNSQMKRHKA